MITVFVKATDTYKLNDLLRSLIGNAEKKENFRIIVGGDEIYQKVIDDYKNKSDISLMKEGDLPKEILTKMVWMISDDVIVLGRQWDKRILFYANKYPDEIIVMFPSGYKHYHDKSEEQVAFMAERNPVVSGKWIELAGMYDVEMICRDLFVKYNIDRRIDIRLVDVTERGMMPARKSYDSVDVSTKANAIADYINAQKNIKPV